MNSHIRGTVNLHVRSPARCALHVQASSSQRPALTQWTLCLQSRRRIDQPRDVARIESIKSIYTITNAEHDLSKLDPEALSSDIFPCL